jgi:hypothetical protein
VWSKEEQWAPLWEDIVRLIEVIRNHEPSATHFLGAIVVQHVPSSLGGLPVWNVIDGQQRLTTLQLLLDALHAELETRGWTMLAEQILSLVENPAAFREVENDRHKLWPTNRDRPAFMSVMAAPVPVDYSKAMTSRLADAHRYFGSQIAAWIGEGAGAEGRARTLVATLTDRLEIASIRLDATEDAQEIFETLNARGTPLSAADLIKNFVFQRLGGDDKRAEDAYLQYWAEFETPFWEEIITTGRIKNSRSSLFLWQWLVARTLTDFPIREVFTQFKYYVATHAPNVGELLPQIKRAADRYRAIIEGSGEKTGELTRTQLFAYRMGTLDSEVARPILIWLDEQEQEGISSADRDKLLATLESWFVRRALVRAQSQGANRLMVDLLGRLSEAGQDQVASVASAFLEDNHSVVGFWPGDDEVRNVLVDIPAYWRYLKGRLRMVLEALEDQKRGYPDGKKLAMGPIVRGTATIEHIMPQSWQRNWPADLDEQQEANRNHLVQTLGNLTIVTQALNGRVSNGPWAKKRDYFLNADDVVITKDAIALAGDDWSEAGIALRTSQMIDQILLIWPAPEGHRGLVESATATDLLPAGLTVDLAQLIAAERLSVGAELRARTGKTGDVTARLGQDGRVFIGDEAFDTPSAAGRSVVGHDVNGWSFWRLAEGGKQLAELRAEYLADLGANDSATGDFDGADIDWSGDQPENG